MSKTAKSDTDQQQFWQMAIETWRSSGLSIRNFCKQEGLSKPAFYTWRKRLTKPQKADPEGGPPKPFIQVSLPKEIRNFGLLDGVWVSDFASVLGLATALRLGLIGAARERIVSANQDTVKDAIYRYVTGQEFSMHIRAVAEAFGQMKKDLDRERQAMEKIWKSREKQIEMVLTNVAWVQGSLEGYLGSKMLPSGLSELEALGESDVSGRPAGDVF